MLQCNLQVSQLHMHSHWRVAWMPCVTIIEPVSQTSRAFSQGSSKATAANRMTEASKVIQSSVQISLQMDDLLKRPCRKVSALSHDARSMQKALCSEGQTGAGPKQCSAPRDDTAPDRLICPQARFLLFFGSLSLLLAQCGACSIQRSAKQAAGMGLDHGLSMTFCNRLPVNGLDS